MSLLRGDGMAGRCGGIALKGKKPADSEDTSSIGRSLDAKGRCRRAVINVTGGILGEFAQQGRVLHRQIRRTMCHPTRRKKALSLTLSENTSKGDGAFSCVFPISSS